MARFGTILSTDRMKNSPSNSILKSNLDLRKRQRNVINYPKYSNSTKFETKPNQYEISKNMKTGT